MAMIRGNQTEEERVRLMRDRYTSHYVVSGSQFIHNNVILLLHRILIPPETASKPTASTHAFEKELMDSVKPLDTSGAYVVEARLEIADPPGDPPGNELVTRGLREMQRLKESMQGVVEFRSVDRMSLGTRVG